MTVSSTTNKSGPYLGNGSTVEFDYEFRILDPSHLTVVMTEDGVDTTVSPSDYTVSGVGASGGGALTFLVAPMTGQSITIIRNAPFTQPTDLENQGAYYAETVEGALDLGVMRDQQLAEGLSRAVQIPIGADPSELGGLIEDIIRLSDSAGEIDTVAGIAAQVSTVAGISANVTTVAGIAANVTTVANIAADVTAVADIAADVTVAANNIAAIIAAPDHAAAAIAAEEGAEAAQAAAEAAAASVDHITVSSRSLLKAVDTSTHSTVYLTETGREGIFVWRAGDYSAQITADPLEGIYVKADAVAATAGAWVRQAGYHVSGLDIRWFGAVPQGNPSDTTTAIQRAMNLAATVSVGRVRVPRGEWRLGKTTTETYLTSAMPVGQQDQYALKIPSGVVLEGDGYLTRLKRYVAATLVVVLCAETVGSVVRNLTIDGNATSFPYVGDTYGSGAGMFVESMSGTEDKMNTLDTLWIEDTPGYGIGVEWGNHRGLTIQNIAIDGTGSDGIDIKRMNSGVFDAKAIVLNAIKVTNFGKTATDVASQAGVDIRGWVTATNLHVYGAWGAQASSGIRIHDTGGGVIGGHHASVNNFFIERTSGGVTTTYGAHNNGGEAAAFVSGVAMGCGYNFYSIAKAGMFSACRAKDASVWNFFIQDGATNTQLIGCSARGSSRGFYIQGDDTTLINPVCEDQTTGIELTSLAARTQIIAPVFVNISSTKIVDAGSETIVSPLEVLMTVASADFVGTDGTAAQPLFDAAQDALTVKAGTTYEIDATIYINRSAGTTSHTTSLLFGGTATATAITYLCMVSNPNFNVLGTQSAIRIQALTAVAITAANTSANEAIAIRLTGILRVNTGGTLIPQFQYSAAPGGAPTVMRNSFFRLTELGLSAFTRQGNVG